MSNTLSNTSIKIVNNTLQIIFEEDWYQEDISSLSASIFNKLHHHKIIERVCGADKEYFRFLWHEHAFILNFECYSQSCWIENEACINQLSIDLLKSSLI